MVDGRAIRIAQLKVSSGYFEALGVKPILGRTFETNDEVRDRPREKTIVGIVSDVRFEYLAEPPPMVYT